jgi:translocation and assembly module TamB
MPKENLDSNEDRNETAKAAAKSFPLRSIAIFAGGIVVVAVLALLILFRSGVMDGIVEARFRNTLDEMGLDFRAGSFRLSILPTEIEFRDAEFRDKLTGEKLIFIREGRIGMTIVEALSMRLSRDVSVDLIELAGAEAWIRFDGDGRSNFANLRLPEPDPDSRLSFRFTSAKVNVSDSIVYFNDEARRISVNGREIFLLAEPLEGGGDELPNHKITLRSKNSTFSYDGRELKDVGLLAEAVVNKDGAEVGLVELTTPAGSTTMSGVIRDWERLSYEFNVASTVNLAQANEILVTGTTLGGVGNFTGKLSGEGERYRIDGEIVSESLFAAGVSLKGLNVNGSAEISGSSYESNGTTLAKMLTFEDLKVDFLRLAGNVRGTGYDFNWLGELEAAAARSPNMSIASLFLSDARAEYKDRQLRMSASRGRAGKYAVGRARFGNLQADALTLSTADGGVSVNARSARTGVFETDDYRLDDVTGQNIRVRNANRRTSVDIDGLRARSAELDGNRANGLQVGKFSFFDDPLATTVRFERVIAENVFIQATRIDGLEIPRVDMRNTREGLAVYTEKARIARLDTDAAVLGSFNVGGVRLTVRRGMIEVSSNDIDVGEVAVKRSETFPEGGKLADVRFGKPIFVLEPSGRYRASADMTLGGGLVGNMDLGAVRSRVTVTNGVISLNDIDADIIGGKLLGDASIATTNRGRTSLKLDLRQLNASKLLALLTGSIIPIEGRTDGKLDITFSGRDGRSISGSVRADIVANAGSAERGLVPIEGKLDLIADNGLFSVNTAVFRSESSLLMADGRLDVRDDNSDLEIRLSSSDAAEVERLIRVTDLMPSVEKQIDALKIAAQGRVDMNAVLKGRINDPEVSGKATFASLSMRGREIGSLTANYQLTPAEFSITDGLLREAAGGTAAFDVRVPRSGTNNISVEADLNGVNAGNLLAALPVDLPERISDLRGSATGRVELSGLPDDARGRIDVSAAKGTIGGHDFDSLAVKAVFEGKLIELQRAEMTLGGGKLSAVGNYDRSTELFGLELDAKAVPVPLVLAVLPRNDSIPDINGRLDGKGTLSGKYGETRSYIVNFNGRIPSLIVGDENIGRVDANIRTEDGQMNADLTADLNGRPQVINATIDLTDESLPLAAVTEFNNSPIAPFLAFIPQTKELGISGIATGRVEYRGSVASRNDRGELVYSADSLEGRANFTLLNLQIRDTPLNAVEPVSVIFNAREIRFENARFAGGGSNMVIAGTKALGETAINNLSLEGRVNLNLVNLFVKDTFFAGFADTKMTLSGPNRTAILSGTADIVNGSIASFIGSDRFTADRISGRLIFTSDQVELVSASGFLGGGKFRASGGGILDGLSVKAFRLSVVGDGITLPLPKNFITTGDANLEVTGIRRGRDLPLETTLSGRVFAQRSLYSRDIDLANVISGRRDPVLSGGGTGSAIRFDLIIEGRDALIVRNNIADLTASVSLALQGDSDNPILSGRITASGGTVFFRKDRYEVQRGVLEFPPNSGIDPIVNLQAESTIAGYQIFVNLSGPLRDTELLSVNVRSSPALPQADIVSLITTGSLANTAGGIPTLAQTGLNTAAEVITDSIINAPIRKATDRLFGLNVFEIDPIIAGRTTNAAARLTVGRQINNNLRVTYSTNLSQDQNQVLAFEYRVSNRLSLVAQYEQRSLSNVTRNRDNFSFEVRLRKRF